MTARDKKVEALSEVHHRAGEIQRLTVLMLSSSRIGRDWLLDMRYAHEHLGKLIKKLEDE